MNSSSNDNISKTVTKKLHWVQPHYRLLNVSNNEISKILSEMENQSDSTEKLKVGLALSGGGFRASFFHLGVLAELARAGILGNIDVISSVSGGSIVGAYYYLSLKRKIKEQDGKTEEINYNELVNEVAQYFYNRTRKNIRNKYYLYSFLPNKSSHRLAKSLDAFFYDEFAEEKKAHFTLGDLCRNSSGLPKLIINTTNLNLGRLCCFSSELADASTNFHEIANQLTQHSPGGYKLDYSNITLGRAVAASSSVPGLFNPVTFDLEYSMMSFVDGGVSDNSGILSLLNDRCNLIIVSDASLYMDYQSQPSSNPFSMAMRTNDIFMDQLKRKTLSSLNENNKNLVYISIREELDEKTPRFINGVIPTTTYGVNSFVQHYLSRMRTDLNKFSKLEAGALMNDGVTICRHILERKPLTREISTFKGNNNENKDTSTEYKFYFENNNIQEELMNPSISFLKIVSISNRRIMKMAGWINDPYKLYHEPKIKNSKLKITSLFVVTIIIYIVLNSMMNDGIINTTPEIFQNALLIFSLRMFIFGIPPLVGLILLMRLIIFITSLLQHFCSVKKILKTKTTVSSSIEESMNISNPKF